MLILKRLIRVFFFCVFCNLFLESILNYILQLKLEKSQLYNYFLKIEMPLVRVLIEMEYFGTFVDSKLLKKMSAQINKNLAKLRNSIFEVSEMEFNINSTQQLSNVLFDVLDELD